MYFKVSPLTLLLHLVFLNVLCTGEDPKECGILHCTSCTQPPALPTRCIDGYELLADGTCSPCPAGCKKCVTVGADQQCEECLDGYYITQYGQCLECLQSICTTCTSVIRCQKCVEGLYVTSTGHCFACPVNCVECELFGTRRDPICTRCEAGYATVIVYSPYCYPVCQPECRVCKVENAVSDEYTCEECEPGYYLSDDSSCTGCGSECIKCGMKDGQATCEECSDGFYVNIFGECSACDLGDKVADCTQGDPTCHECEAMHDLGEDATTCVRDYTAYCYTCSSGECGEEAQIEHLSICPGLGSTGSCWSTKSFSVLSSGVKVLNTSYTCQADPCLDHLDQQVCRYDQTTDPQMVCTWCCETPQCNQKPPAGIKITLNQLEEILNPTSPTTSTPTSSDTSAPTSSAGGHRLRWLVRVGSLEVAVEMIDILILWLVLLLLTRKF